MRQHHWVFLTKHQNILQLPSWLKIKGYFQQYVWTFSFRRYWDIWRVSLCRQNMIFSVSQLRVLGKYLALSQWKLKCQLLFLVTGLFSPFLTCYFKNLICMFARYVTAFVYPPLGVRMCFLSSAWQRQAGRVRTIGAIVTITTHCLYKMT